MSINVNGPKWHTLVQFWKTPPKANLLRTSRTYPPCPIGSNGQNEISGLSRTHTRPGEILRIFENWTKVWWSGPPRSAVFRILDHFELQKSHMPHLIYVSMQHIFAENAELKLCAEIIARLAISSWDSHVLCAKSLNWLVSKNSFWALFRIKT